MELQRLRAVFDDKRVANGEKNREAKGLEWVVNPEPWKTLTLWLCNHAPLPYFTAIRRIGDSFDHRQRKSNLNNALFHPSFDTTYCLLKSACLHSLPVFLNQCSFCQPSLVRSQTHDLSSQR
jgi:hypothetical protein